MQYMICAETSMTKKIEKIDNRESVIWLNDVEKRGCCFSFYFLPSGHTAPPSFSPALLLLCPILPSIRSGNRARLSSDDPPRRTFWPALLAVRLIATASRLFHRRSSRPCTYIHAEVRTTNKMSKAKSGTCIKMRACVSQMFHAPPYQTGILKQVGTRKSTNESTFSDTHALARSSSSVNGVSFLYAKRVNDSQVAWKNLAARTSQCTGGMPGRRIRESLGST